MSPIGVPVEHASPTPSTGGDGLEPEVGAWHDVTCPEGPECRDRALHARGMPVVYGGVLSRFLERYEALRGPTSSSG